jgi:transketolase
MKKMGMYCGEMLSLHMDSDPDIYVLDGDLADSDGAIYIHNHHPNRFIMAGIAEQSMVSIAAGLATVKRKPWVFSFAAFLCYRAYDQIRIGISQGNLNVKLVGSHAGGFSGRNGQTHAAINDVAIMTSLPNMEIWSPACPADLSFAIKQMTGNLKPTYLRLPREPLSDLQGQQETWYWLFPKQRINILVYGITVHIALQVLDLLLTKNLRVGVIVVNRIWPLPDNIMDTLESICTDLIVIEDHYRIGGIGSILSLMRLSCKVHSIGWNLNFTGQSGDYNDVLENFELNPLKISEQILKIN